MDKLYFFYAADRNINTGTAIPYSSGSAHSPISRPNYFLFYLKDAIGRVIYYRKRSPSPELVDVLVAHLPACYFVSGQFFILFCAPVMLHCLS